jgi:hypothetical protein
MTGISDELAKAIIKNIAENPEDPNTKAFVKMIADAATETIIPQVRIPDPTQSDIIVNDQFKEEIAELIGKILEESGFLNYVSWLEWFKDQMSQKWPGRQKVEDEPAHEPQQTLAQEGSPSLAQPPEPQAQTADQVATPPIQAPQPTDAAPGPRRIKIEWGEVT